MGRESADSSSRGAPARSPWARGKTSVRSKPRKFATVHRRTRHCSSSFSSGPADLPSFCRSHVRASVSGAATGAVGARSGTIATVPTPLGVALLQPTHQDYVQGRA